MSVPFGESLVECHDECEQKILVLFIILPGQHLLDRCVGGHPFDRFYDLDNRLVLGV